MNTISSTYLVFPEDLNPSGTIFGGRIMSLMDIEAAKLGYLLIMDRNVDNVVTKFVNNIDFHAPAVNGDILEITATLASVGKTSLTISVTVNRLTVKDTKELICESSFVMVTMRQGSKDVHGIKLIENEN